MKKPRDYKHEYKTYHAKPKQKQKEARAKRNAARREYERKHGDLPSTTEVHHKKRLAKGGSNSAGNTAAVSRAKNRGWRKGKKGYDR